MADKKIAARNQGTVAESKLQSDDKAPAPDYLAPLAHAVGRSRFVVLLAAIAVILVAISLFLLGTYLAIVKTWGAWVDVFGGELETAELTTVFLEIVSLMLKAVVFYIVGIGLYSLFIAPLNLPIALGVETLNDLETKVVSVVIVIIAVTFLEHFIAWEEPAAILQHGGTAALIIVALVLFQFYNHRAKEDQSEHATPRKAKRDLFQKDHEEKQPTA